MNGITSTVLIYILFSQTNFLFGQVQRLQTESETHIFWQPNRKLNLNDFQGDPRSDDLKYCEENGYCAVPCLGVFVEVDIPKNYRKNKLEKVYFAPAFQKTCSYIINDSKEIRDAQLLFDIAELSSRIGRKLLREYHNHLAVTEDSMNYYIIREHPDTVLITGVGTSLAWHARDSAWNFYKEMSASYISGVYLSNGKESYEQWRLLVDDYLENYKNYATKPEECYRMIKKQPIIKKYKRAYR